MSLNQNRHSSRLQGMILKSIVLGAFLVVAAGTSLAQPSAPPLPQGSEEGTLAFERPELTFAPQSTGIENCANIAIENSTNTPRLLTRLYSLDPKHFSITSPAAEMLPLTVGSNTTFYLNVCFKASEVKAYDTKILAIFQTDTVVLRVTGKGLAPPQVLPVPSETGITDVQYKKHNWAFTFGLKSRGTIKLTLEDMMSKVVRIFPFPDLKSPGFYETTFDEKSDAGKKLPKGVYVLRLEVADPVSHTLSHSSRLITIK